MSETGCTSPRTAASLRLLRLEVPVAAFEGAAGRFGEFGLPVFERLTHDAAQPVADLAAQLRELFDLFIEIAQPQRRLGFEPQFVGLELLEPFGLVADLAGLFLDFFGLKPGLENRLIGP